MEVPIARSYVIEPVGTAVSVNRRPAGAPRQRTSDSARGLPPTRVLRAVALLVVVVLIVSDSAKSRSVCRQFLRESVGMVTAVSEDRPAARRRPRSSPARSRAARGGARRRGGRVSRARELGGPLALGRELGERACDGLRRRSPSCSSRAATAASPQPRSASARARAREPAVVVDHAGRRSVSTAASASGSAMPRASSRCRRRPAETSRRDTVRTAVASASERRSSRRRSRSSGRSSSRPGREPAADDDVVRHGAPRPSVELERHPARAAPADGRQRRRRGPAPCHARYPVGCGCFGLRGLSAPRRRRPSRRRHREEARGDDRVRPELGLDGAEDPLGDVRVLPQERGRVLAALAEPLVAEAEVRARLLDDLPLEPDVERRCPPRRCPRRR